MPPKGVIVWAESPKWWGIPPASQVIAYYIILPSTQLFATYHLLPKSDSPPDQWSNECDDIMGSSAKRKVIYFGLKLLAFFGYQWNRRHNDNFIIHER